MKRRTRHMQSIVRTPTGRRMLVDRNMALLISCLQALRVNTIASCEAGCGGHCKRQHPLILKKRLKDVWHFKYRRPTKCKESVWIAFKSVNDAKRFLKLVHKSSDPDDLQGHMQGHNHKDRHSWIWSIHIEDIEFTCHLVMPRHHLKLITSRVMAHL
jgi:hypothetical protein